MVDVLVKGQNAELVRRGYAAFNAADMDTLAKLFDDNAVWHTPGRSPMAGDYKGVKAILAQFGRYGGETAGTFKAKLQYLCESDDGRVIGVHQNTADQIGRASCRERVYVLV